MRPSAPRRTSFAQELEKRARAWGDQLSQTYEFAFRRRYGLPPTDPRYLNATVEEIVVDWHANRFWDDPKLRQEEVVNDSFEDMVKAMEAMNVEKLARPDSEPPPPRVERIEGPLPEAIAPEAMEGAMADEWEDVVDDRY